MHRYRVSSRTAFLVALSLTAAPWSARTPAQATTDYGSQRHTVQPGADLDYADRNHECTAGFLLKDSSGAVYVVTGDQCAPPETGSPHEQPPQAGGQLFRGQRTWPVGLGPVAMGIAPYYRPVGRLVAQSLAAGVSTPEYSIVRLNRGISYDGAVAVYGGPSRIPYQGETTGATQVYYVCPDGPAVYYGLPAVGSGPYRDGAQTDVAVNGIRHLSFRIAGPDECFNYGGDPVVGLDGNQALGIVTGETYGVPYPTDPDGPLPGETVFRLDAIMRDASALLHRRFTLVHAGQHGTA